MKLTKKRIILIAAAGLAGFVVIVWLLFSGPRMRNQPSLRAFETQANLPPEHSVIYSPGKADAENPDLIENSETSFSNGKTYYGYYCIFCHGTLGDGNGPVGQSFVPKPADLSNDSIRAYNFNQLYKAAFTGTGHDPVLERVVPEEFRPYILLYVREQFGH